MIGNLQDELYQLENRQAKGATLCAWKTEYEKSNKIWIIYWW